MVKLFLFASLISVTLNACSPKLSADHNWGNQRWVLMELRSVPVQLSGTRRDAYLEFNPHEHRFTGNGGCNRLSGEYSLEKKDRIKLGEIISTKMSCEDIAFETAFVTTLNDARKYQASGNILTFSDGNQIILRFEARTRARNP
jgi:heat shock protein HslJ